MFRHGHTNQIKNNKTRRLIKKIIVLYNKLIGYHRKKSKTYHDDYLKQTTTQQFYSIENLTNS